MTRRASLILTVALLLLGVGCGAEDGVLLKPEGTVFPKEKALGYTPDDTGAPGCDTCGTDATISAGFRATVDGMNLEVGEQNVVAISAVMSGMSQLTANLLDGTGRNHTFVFGFRSTPGQYGVVLMQNWLPDLTKAGLQYSQSVSGSSVYSATDASGSLTILDMSNGRVSGRFAGQAVLQGEELALQADFNVPMTEQ